MTQRAAPPTHLRVYVRERGDGVSVYETSCGLPQWEKVKWTTEHSQTTCRRCRYSSAYRRTMNLPY